MTPKCKKEGNIASLQATSPLWWDGTHGQFPEALGVIVDGGPEFFEDLT
jgi:hypothetical protein